MNDCTTHDVLAAVGLEFVLVLSIIFIVPVALVEFDTLIILDVIVLMDSTIILDMLVLDTPVLGVIFGAFVATGLGTIFAVLGTLVLAGFKFGVEMTGILVEIGVAVSPSSYIR